MPYPAGLHCPAEKAGELQLGADQINGQIISGVHRLAVIDIDSCTDGADPRNHCIAPTFFEERSSDLCGGTEHGWIRARHDLERENPMQDLDVVGQEDRRGFGVNDGVGDVPGHDGRRCWAS